jgi:hypothetical protein
MVLQFMPRHPFVATPGRDLLIPPKGPAIASFLMRPERRERSLARQSFQNVNDRPLTHNQRLAKPPKLFAQFC